MSDFVHLACFSNYGVDSFYGRISSCTKLELCEDFIETFCWVIDYATSESRTKTILFLQDKFNRGVLLFYRARNKENNLWDFKFSTQDFDSVSAAREYCIALPDDVLPVYCLTRNKDTFFDDLVDLMKQGVPSITWEYKAKRVISAQCGEKNALVFNLFATEEFLRYDK